MEDERADSLTPEEPILQKVAREAGEPALFPPLVLRLHREGRALKARKELIRHARSERNERLAQLQRARAADLYLWREALDSPPTMYSLNGIGTRLLGRYQPTQEGLCISTLWFTIVFLPVWPLRAYLVLPAPKGGWRFFARTPIPPNGARARKITGTVTTLLAALLAWTLYWSATHVDLYVYNGFDRPVWVEVDDQEHVVPAWGTVLVENLPGKITRLSAEFDGHPGPLEESEVDLSGHARETVVYNVAGRGVLRIESVTFGDEDAPVQGEFLRADPVLFEERVDYPFEEPPDSIWTSSDDPVTRSVLYSVGAGAAAIDVVSTLVELGRPEQALTVARAELLANPTDAQLILFAATVLLANDFDAQLELVRDALERSPDEVELHRLYQELSPRDGRDTVRARGASLD